MQRSARKPATVSSKLAAEKDRATNAANDNAELNMEDIIAQVLQQQQSTLEAVVQNAVKGALQEINTSLQYIRTELERQDTTVQDLKQQVDDTKRKNREISKSVKACVSDQKELEQKLAELEDRSRRNNVRITGLAEGREASDPIGFLQRQLPVWIPTLRDRPIIEIERAHRIYAKGKGKKPGSRTMIFKCLRHQDRQAILNGARQAQKTGPITDNTTATGPITDNTTTTIRFKADYSAYTMQRRQQFIDVQSKLHAKGVLNFLIYPATLKVTHRGQQLLFETANEAGDFCENLGEEVYESDMDTDAERPCQDHQPRVRGHPEEEEMTSSEMLRQDQTESSRPSSPVNET